MKQIPVALQLYSVRNEYKLYPDACLNAIADMGYSGVDFYGSMDRPAETLKRALGDAGLELVGWHTPLEWLMPDRLDSTIAYMKKVGNPRLICPSVGEEYRTKAKLIEVSEYFTRLCTRLAGEGLRTGYHCHGFDFADYGGISGWELIADNTPSDFILQLDNGNCESGGGDSLSMLKKYPGRGEILHIKPYSRLTGYMTMIGEDTIDWRATFDEIYRQGACEWLVVEYDCAELYTQLEGARKCLEIVKRLNA